MRIRQRTLTPTSDRGPLRVLFFLTSMPVGGAETLLASLVRGMRRERFAPEICCLKAPGPLGEQLAHELPVHCGLLAGKWDIRVLTRLRRLMRERRIDAVVTVGAGDKMFWGRLAAWWNGVPVICAAIHSTGWPDSIGRLNRALTPLTDAFIAVARPHAEYLVTREGFPRARVHTIPNGIDTGRFQPRRDARSPVRDSLGIPATSPVIGVVAALRPEKNLSLFLQAAARTKINHPDAHFLVVGDGPERGGLEQLAGELSLAECTHFAGTRAEIPELLSAVDVFTLTSQMEANPVSILEALACEVPVVAPRIGSIPETVIPDQTGLLVTPGSAEAFAAGWSELLADPSLRRRLGAGGRALVCAEASLDAMVNGYERLLTRLYDAKAGLGPGETVDEACRPGDSRMLLSAGGRASADG